MKEDFLHFVWKNKLFNQHDLKTVNNDKIEIIELGKHNSDAGPDFFDARIKINNIIWVGNLEIHIDANHWNTHKHNSDPAYNNVILHVVFSNEKEIFTQDEKLLNCLIISFPDNIYLYYKEMLSSKKWIPCADKISLVDEFYISSFLQRILIERMQSKIEVIEQLYYYNKKSIEETFYQLISRYFGLKINGQPFEQLARSIPINIIGKQKNSLLHIEALLLGQAGFLSGNTCTDEYFLLLKQEYNFLKNKYKLIPMDVSLWKFLRLRPANFPTLRIAQLAALLYNTSSLFSQFVNLEPIHEKRKILNVEASKYWDTHYLFGEKTKFKKKILGQTMKNIIIINTIVPMMFFIGKKNDDFKISSMAIDILNNMKPENNIQITNWKKINVKVNSAADSQALLQLKVNYCDKFKCLNCEIAHQILTKIWSANS